MVHIKFIKEMNDIKIGDIRNADKEVAEEAIEMGYAEYVETVKELIPEVDKG